MQSEILSDLTDHEQKVLRQAIEPSSIRVADTSLSGALAIVGSSILLLVTTLLTPLDAMLEVPIHIFLFALWIFLITLGPIIMNGRRQLALIRRLHEIAGEARTTLAILHSNEEAT